MCERLRLWRRLCPLGGQKPSQWRLTTGQGCQKTTLKAHVVPSTFNSEFTARQVNLCIFECAQIAPFAVPVGQGTVESVAIADHRPSEITAPGPKCSWRIFWRVCYNRRTSDYTSSCARSTPALARSTESPKHRATGTKLQMTAWYEGWHGDITVKVVATPGWAAGTARGCLPPRGWHGDIGSILAKSSPTHCLHLGPGQ